MIRLVRVELRRLVNRRAVRMILSLPFLVFLVVAVVQSIKHHKDGSGSGVYSFTEHWPPDATLLVVLFALCGFLIGASSIGAEWGAGTYAHLLLWEPRRLRVLAAKVVAVLILLLVTAVLGFAWCAGMDALTAAVSGSFGGSSRIVGEAVARFGRGLVVVAVFTAVGSAVAGLARNSAAALGALVAYFVVFEGILRGVWAGSQRWTLVNNAQALIIGHVDLQGTTSGNSPPCTQDPCVTFTSAMHKLSLTHGVVFLVVVAVGLTGMAALQLTRRDVT